MTTDASFDREAFAEFERSGWRRAAPHYDSAFSRLTAQAAPHLVEFAGVKQGTRLLDVACGPGAVTALALRAGVRVTAVDFSPEMLAMAKARNPGAEFREADAQALPFGDASFDALTMSFLLGHLSDHARALSEACRVLMPGGRIALSWWTPADQSVAFAIILGAVEAAGNTEVGLPRALPFHHFRDPDMIGAALAEAGFVDVESRLAEMTWTVDSTDEVFEAYLNGSVRTGGLLQRQTPEALAAIRTIVAAKTQAYARDGRIALPMPAWIIGARKPA